MFRILAALLSLVPVILHAAAPKPGEYSQITFSESPPHSDALEVKLRLSAAETPPAYDVKKELFDLRMPKNYREGTPHGLFIWISAGDKPSIPAEWEAVLDEKKLIFIGAHKSGNPRSVFDRMRLAIDANYNVRKIANIDSARVIVSGFSGGARVASMLGVCYADIFPATICCMGVNFYTDVATPDGRQTFRLGYLPHDDFVKVAKTQCRYVLITGEKDFNLPNTQAVFTNGFQKEGFKAVEMLNIPAQGHSPPKAEWLKRAVEFIDEPAR
jgi:predicted esterase